MKSSFFNSLILLLLLVTGLSPDTTAQQAPAGEDPAYTKTINQRADKIVNTLGLTDSVKASRVQVIITQQYRDLNAIHTPAETQTKQIKNQADSPKEQKDAQVKAIEDETNKKLEKLHGEYIGKLSAELTTEQVDKVKDGMTYGVLPITYKGYLDMIARLTEEEKKQIYDYLAEARERAMDASSSDKKHAWFGKYKGKINNYLSSHGYNMKEESEAWEKRRKAAGEKL
jgi:hypothetical protein